MINDLIGRLDHQDLSFITKQEVQQYQKNLLSKNQKNQRIPSMYPYTHQSLLHILETLLEFNPHFRVQSKEVLKNKIFDSVRVPLLEKPAPLKIKVENDLSEYFNYEKCKNVAFDD